MAKETMSIGIGTVAALGVEIGKVQGSLGGLEKTLAGVKSGITAAFSVGAVVQFGSACTRILGALGVVFGKVSEQSEDASAAAKNVGKTVTRTTSTVRRALAGFDEIDRLDTGSVSSTTTTTTPIPLTVESNIDSTAAEFEQACGKISGLCAALHAPLDTLKQAFEDVCAGFRASWETHGGSILQGVQTFKENIGQTFGILYDNVIRPLCQKWGNDFDWLWQEHLEPLWNSISEGTLNAGDDLLKLWNEAIAPNVNKLAEVWTPKITDAIRVISDLFELKIAFGVDKINLLTKVLDGLTQFLTGVFTGNWKLACEGIQKAWNGAWDGIKNSCKSCLNKAILAVNTMMLELVRGLNNMIKKVNKLSISLPDWEIFGSSAGKRWSLGIQELALPPVIPYLAQGAVLPANKPFMAMVGDQKHGTNVEAPLATIQEAVALTMSDQLEAMSAGFDATVEMQKRILEAVLGIRIGDDVIGAAAQRYDRMMARAGGGAL